MHESYMKTALSLARRGAGKTSPNPMVGCVVVKGGKTVGKGYHRAAGKPHAELEALSQAGGRARGSTLYVSLEPCCHWGRTPPCTDAIIEAGVREVVAAMEDPNPKVAGKGLKTLQRAGIKTTCGVLEGAARRLNEAYAKHVTSGLPFVTLKAGMSLDGKISTSSGESRWITGEASRDYVHRMRATSDAIMVGIETVLKDDPKLTARPRKGMGRNPVRVVVDSRLRVPLSAKIFDPRSDARVIVATTGAANARKLEKLKAMDGAVVLSLEGPKGRVDLSLLMRDLGEMGIASLLAEGGSEVNASLLRDGLVDKVMFFLAPMIIGGRRSPGVIGGEGIVELTDAVRLTEVRSRRLGEDLLVEGYIAKK
jgi:diaminohydroxyphosphoribosylaminopyrimidine deaminase/5-amino-6-(5-phosphoribosylamino)uracil reductase